MNFVLFKFVSDLNDKINIMIYNYAEDATIYASEYKKEEIIRKLENDTAILTGLGIMR